MKALVIYDLTGHIWNIIYGADSEPEGLLSMWVDIPEGSILNSIDVTDPLNHKPIFAHQEPSDIKKLQEDMADIKSQINPSLDAENCTLKEAIEYQISQFGKESTAAIYAGQDIETSKGTFHFRYTDYDQKNLKTLYDFVKETTLPLPYHADKVDTEMWDPLDIIKIYFSNEEYKTYHTTYCNLLNNICRECTSKEEVLAMSYGMELPEDKKSVLMSIMLQAQDFYRDLYKVREAAVLAAQ